MILKKNLVSFHILPVPSFPKNISSLYLYCLLDCLHVYPLYLNLLVHVSWIFLVSHFWQWVRCFLFRSHKNNLYNSIFNLQSVFSITRYLVLSQIPRYTEYRVTDLVVKECNTVLYVSVWNYRAETALRSIRNYAM